MDLSPDQKKRLLVLLVVTAALIIPVALAVIGGWRLWKARQLADAEFAESLRFSLERAANVVLPTPTLGPDAIVLICPADKFEAEVQRVVRLANGLGGSASSWNDGTSIRIVANIPSNSVDLFRSAVTRRVFDIAGAGESGPMTVVEVLLRADL
jgi:hypothetical protein